MEEHKQAPSDDRRGQSASSPHDQAADQTSTNPLPPVTAPTAGTSSPAVTLPGSWPSTLAKERVDFVNKCLQIAAIIVAGFWALLVFIDTIAPVLEPKLNVTGDIAWRPTPNSDVCEGQFMLTVKNPGPGSVEVRDATVKIWVEDFTTVADGTGRLVLKPTERAPSTIDKNLLTGEEDTPTEKPTAYQSGNVEPLTEDIRGHYPPGGENNSSQIFLFKKQPNNFTLIKVGLTGTGYKFYPFKQNITNWGYAMDRVCGPPAEEKSLPKTTNPALPGTPSQNK